MSMLIPGQNQLAEPAIIKVDEFEPLLAEFKAFVIDYVATRAPQSAAKLQVSLDNESELLTLALEAFCVRLQTHERKYNARIKQMLAWWATGSNLDARLADMGLERQVLDPGDPAAFPPVPPTLESDDDARLRYYLAPHAPAAGSRMHYRREVFTLGERPAVKVQSATPGVVTVTYTFDPDGYAAQVKDGNARRTASRTASTAAVRNATSDAEPSFRNRASSIRTSVSTRAKFPSTPVHSASRAPASTGSRNSAGNPSGRTEISTRFPDPRGNGRTRAAITAYCAAPPMARSNSCSAPASAVTVSRYVTIGRPAEA